MQVLAFLALLWLGCAALPTQYYINPQGIDAGNCTESNKCRTLTFVVGKNNDNKEQAIITMDPGPYNIPASLNAQYPVTINGPGANVSCISGITCLSFVDSSTGSSISGVKFSGGDTQLSVQVNDVAIYNTTFENAPQFLAVENVQNFSLSNSHLSFASSESSTAVSFLSVGNVQILDSTFENFNNPAYAASVMNFDTVTDIIVSNCKFMNNNGTGSALVFSSADHSVLVEKCLFQNNTAYANDGAALHISVVTSGTNCVISDSEFYYNTVVSTDYEAGALLIASQESPVNVSNCTFAYNTAYSGGAIGVLSSSANIINSRFYSNLGLNSGGAVYGASNSVVSITNSLFSQNNASTNVGGAVYTDSVTTTTIEACIFNNNSAQNGGAIAADSGLTVRNSSFFGNFLTLYGGAIYMSAGLANSLVESSNFTWNAGQQGGGIFTNGPLTVSMSQFSYNHGSISGGAIFGNGATSAITSTNCTYFNNTAVDGGAIYVTSGMFADTGSTVSKNYGGGFSLNTGPPATLTRTTFSYNEISLHGAGLYLNQVNANCSECQFTGNVALSAGGAVYVDGPATEFFDACHFSDNVGVYSGGAINAVGLTTIYLSNSQLQNNSVPINGGGGAIALDTSTLIDTNSTYTNNFVLQGDAGAIYFYTSGTADASSISGSSFYGNSAFNSGGAIYVLGLEVSVTRSHFNNNAAGSGGAVYISTGGNFVDQYSTYSGNTAGDGGAIMTDNSMSLSGATFENNQAQSGGAIYVQNLNFSLGNSTFSDNSATKSGGAMYFIQTIKVAITDVDFHDCIFKGNSADTGGAMYFTGTPEFTFSNVMFQSNRATTSGGGFYSTHAILPLHNATFWDNTAVDRGGALYLEATSDFSCTQCSFLGNSAHSYGGALAVEDSSIISLLEASITGNSAQYGGGVSMRNSSSGLVSQCNITNNAASYGGGIYLETGVTIQLGIIDNNTDTGIFINSLDAEQKMTMNSTVLSNTGPFEFCCGGVPAFNITKSTCNYPSCNQYCGGRNGTCVCNNTGTPACNSCPSPYTGAFCNTIDQCQQNGFCNTTHQFCGHDTQYNFQCCPSMDNCLDTCLPQCQNGGNCTSTQCSCIGGWTGTDCTTHTCVYPCQNGGNCTAPNTCTCATGWAGIVCLTPQCQQMCKNGGTCTNVNTCTCATGFTGSDCSMIADVCQPNNGGCDYHTNCTTNMMGHRVCSDCPIGFVFANGNTTCNSLCGDQNCSVALGENCVTCPEDCLVSPCNQCGDKHCDQGNETCSTCSEDCGLCIAPPCADPTCSGHGKCQSGVCICNDQWSGVSCNQNSAPLQVNISQPGNDPGLSVTPQGGSARVSFTIAITSIKEIDENKNFVQGINLASQNFTFSSVNTSSLPPPTGPCTNCSLPSYLSSSSPSTTSNKQYLLSTPLENTAYLEIMIFQFNDPETTITFAKNSSTYSQNTIKLAIQIRSWPFRSLHNSLSIIFASPQTSLSSACHQVDSNTDENNNLKWFTININGSTLYGTFLDASAVDGNIRNVNFTLNSDYTVSATLPHFWTNAVVDPNFSVLLQDKPKNCEEALKKGKNVKKVVAIVVPVVVVVVVAAVAILIYFWPKIHQRTEVYRTNKRFKKGNQLESESSNSIEIEKLHSLNVNSSAGNFNVRF